MIVTPQMGKEDGTTAEQTGALLDLADVVGWDGTGAKASVAELFGDYSVKIEADSFSHPHSSVYLDPDDAEAFARVILARAAEARAAAEAYRS